MATAHPRMTHKVAIQLHLVTDGYIVCSSRSRRPVPKILDMSNNCILVFINCYPVFGLYKTVSICWNFSRTTWARVHEWELLK